MYEAKRMRTGHEVYLPARDRHSRERLALVGELHGALEAGELVLHYQPKADLRTGAVRGVEALVRWQHPERGLLGPGHFLPLVEQSGLTRALTAFVLDRALARSASAPRRRRARRRRQPRPGRPARPRAARRRSSASCSCHGFDPSSLQLEVSEDVVMADLERTVEVLARPARGSACPIALDDFGAGHARRSGSSSSCDVDELKIDRSFVMRLGEDERDAAIVHSIVDLGRRLGLRVVAEGVETEAAWTLLAEWGCDEAQGHLLGRPMPIAELEPGCARSRRGPPGRRACPSGPWSEPPDTLSRLARGIVHAALMSAGLAALLDDVAVLARAAAASVDDVAAGASRASMKAAGVIVDDAAVTPRYVQGFRPERELPMIKRIAVGSLRNKLLFILPAALLLSELLPWLLTPILMVGGTYLCYEGAEKLWELVGPHDAHATTPVERAGAGARGGARRRRDPDGLHPLGRDHGDLAQRGRRRAAASRAR